MDEILHLCNIYYICTYHFVSTHDRGYKYIQDEVSVFLNIAVCQLGEYTKYTKILVDLSSVVEVV